MTLNLYEPSLGEVPRTLRWLYRLDAERGGYRLDVDLGDHDRGLKAALATERQCVKVQRGQITELRRQVEVISVGGQ